MIPRHKPDQFWRERPHMPVAQQTFACKMADGEMEHFSCDPELFAALCQADPAGALPAAANELAAARVTMDSLRLVPPCSPMLPSPFPDSSDGVSPQELEQLPAAEDATAHLQALLTVAFGGTARGGER
jgi:hypothetical protein